MPRLPGPIPSAAQKILSTANIVSSSSGDVIEAIQEGNFEEYVEQGAQDIGNEVEQIVSDLASGIGEITASSLEFGFGVTWDVFKPLLVNYWYVIIPLLALSVYLLYKFLF